MKDLDYENAYEHAYDIKKKINVTSDFSIQFIANFIVEWEKVTAMLRGEKKK